jgi:hypothetical protein
MINLIDKVKYNSDFEFALDPELMKLIDNIKNISPIVYSKWQTMPKFEWGPRPDVLID